MADDLRQWSREAYREIEALELRAQERGEEQRSEADAEMASFPPSGVNAAQQDRLRSLLDMFGGKLPPCCMAMRDAVDSGQDHVMFARPGAKGMVPLVYCPQCGRHLGRGGV